MSRIANKEQLLSLYRSYVRIVEDWPVDKIRPNRGMKQVLAKRVEDAFRNKDTVDMKDAHQELYALESLLSNKFKEKYPISDKILNPAGNPNYYSKLISSLEANKDGQKSTLAKLLGK